MVTSTPYAVFLATPSPSPPSLNCFPNPLPVLHAAQIIHQCLSHSDNATRCPLSLDAMMHALDRLCHQYRLLLHLLEFDTGVFWGRYERAEAGDHPLANCLLFLLCSRCDRPRRPSSRRVAGIRTSLPFWSRPAYRPRQGVVPRRFLSVVSTVVDDFEFVGGGRVKEERRCYMLRKCDMREWLVVVG